MTQEVSCQIAQQRQEISYVPHAKGHDMTPADIIKALELNLTDEGEMKILQDDFKFLKILQDNIKPDQHGYYTMSLPFRCEPTLPDTKPMAEKRLQLLKRKFKSNPVYLQEYATFMESIISRGDAELVPADEMDVKACCIPHFRVYHPKKTKKSRVVFDCSAKYQSVCLNDFLLQGPDLLNWLTEVLLRFRRE